MYNNTAIGIIILFALTACVSSGIKVDQSKLANLKKGKTTYGEIVQELGKPSQTFLTDDGSKTILYTYFSSQARPETFIPYVGAFVGGADTESSYVSMTFDRNGILQRYSSTQGSTGTGTGLEANSQPRNNAQPGIVQ